jgi:membrane protein DedA with SNARE-associated domain
MSLSVQVLIVFLATLVHEDSAIVSGAYLMHSQGMTMPVAMTTLMFGVVAGDLGIYGLGTLAARVVPLRRFVLTRITPSRRDWLDRNLMSTLVACRIAPGLLFPTFLTCGFLSVPFRRFAMGVIGTALLYVPLMLLAVLAIGEDVIERLGPWGWGALLVMMVGVGSLRKHFRPAKAVTTAAPLPLPLTHPGMPQLERSQVRVAPSEEIPVIPYYVPVFLQWLWLALRYRSLTLPTAANPGIEAGGLLGESKAACLSLAGTVARPYIATWASITRVAGDSIEPSLTVARAAIAAAGLSYPFVVKPDIGWRGFGVRLVKDEAELAEYLGAYPAGENLLLQEFLPWSGEAAIFWLRRPGQQTGEIFSLTLRYFPFVVGDGVATIRQLIETCPRMSWKAKELCAGNADRLDEVPADGQCVRLAVVGSNRVAGLYIDGARHATPALAARMDELCGDLKDFHFGRLDVRFETIEQLRAGEGFKVVEINGAGAEAVHIWDPDYPVLKGYRTLFRQQSLMFAIAAANRARGTAPMSVRELIACQRRQQRLLSRYPASG